MPLGFWIGLLGFIFAVAWGVRDGLRQRFGFAVQMGDEKRVLRLLAARPDRAAQPESMKNAILGRKPNMLRILFEHGADANSKVSSDYANPLEFACEFGNAEIVRVLFEHGARFDRSRSGSMLFCAALHDVEIMELFLENGADPNQITPGEFDVAQLKGYLIEQVETGRELITAARDGIKSFKKTASLLKTTRSDDRTMRP